MKSILLVLLTFVSTLSFADDSTPKGYCQAKAVEYVELLNNKQLEEIGVIQGYEEAYSVVMKQTEAKKDSEYYITFNEDYTISISGNNDEGDWWVTEYQVIMDTTLDSKDKSLLYCNLDSLVYKGIVDQGSYEDEE